MGREEVVGRVERQIRGLVRNKVPIAGVLDVVQESFLSCIEAGYLLGADWKEPSRAFVATVARRRIADYCRARERDRERRLVHLAEDFELAAPECRDTPENRDERRHIREIVARLDKRYRQVIEARYFQGWPDRKIASWLGKPLETIRTWRKRGLRAIRSVLESAS